MVDPEALVLMSFVLMDEERRLQDLARSWASRNSDLLSVQRAKNLAADYPERAREGLNWFAGIALTEGKDMRWRSIVDRLPARGTASVPPVRSGKERAVRVRFGSSATLLLRLRLGFGVGAKADVLAFLLGSGGRWVSVRDISTATGYTVAAIRRAAEDMAAARLIESAAGPPAAFRADREAWNRVLGLEKTLPPWRNWHQRFAFVAAFLAWAQAAAGKPLTPYAAGVAVRELMEQHRSAFANDVAVWSEHTPVVDWWQFAGTALTALAHWMPVNA
jgi:hypothetical protein